MDKHILVLDDDLFTRKLIGMMLERAGYRVTGAATAEEALETLATSRVDAITCDLMMPGMDGVSFLEHLKSTPEYAHIPVVVITAAGLSGPLEKVRSIGVAAVIEKPFLDAPLRAAIEKALGTS